MSAVIEWWNVEMSSAGNQGMTLKMQIQPFDVQDIPTFIHSMTADISPFVHL